MLIVLLAFMITLAAVVTEDALHSVAEKSQRAEVLLLQLQGSAYRLSALEWQAISEREMSAKIVAGVQRAQDAMKRTMGSLEQLDVNAGNLRSVRQIYDAYRLAMNEEFRLIEAGDLVQAERVDEELVDPAFDALIQVLNSTGAGYRTTAQQMEQLDFFGSILIVLIAVVTIGALVWQTQKAQAATEAAAAEQRVLTRGQAELRLFADNVPSMTVSFDGNLRCVFANKRYADLFGFDRTDVIGRHLREILGENAYSEVETHYAQVLQGRPVTYQSTFELQDGKTRYHETRLVPDIGHQGKVLGCFAVTHDITERKETEGRIVHLNRVYAVLSGINTLIVHVRDRDELFREACRIAVEAGGFRMSLIAIVDRSVMKIVPVASAGVDEELLTAIKGMLSSSESAPNTMIARAMRDKKAVVSNDSQSDPRALLGKKHAEAGVRSLAVLPLTIADEAVGILALYANESEFFHEEEMKLLSELAGDIAFAIDHIEKQERLNYLAYYDVLTGLANRTLFLERVGQYMRGAVSGGHKLALFLVDLERFKNINDSLGRPAGDALLKQVAAWTTHNVGDANLLARIDADHFAVVLPEVKQDGDVARLLEKSIDAFLEHPFRAGDAEFRIAAKVGVALFPDDGADADTLFRNAEAALKKAKSSGERYLFHTREMTEAVAGELALENQLREALDNEEFVLHYQPKVDLASGAVRGLEALIRWQKPGSGLVAPGTFIPLLEKTGLILGVGKWALSKALAQHREWTARGIAAPRIAVNVSAIQLQQKDFMDVVIGALQEHGDNPDALEIEVTESLLMQDVPESIRKLSLLRGLGIHVAMDDFGTGHSSLSYLARLPLNSLKIDRSFITEMANSPQDMSIVTTIIALAHSLNLGVVAEGVETESQSKLLKLLKCDEAQGYLFSKPLPAAEIEPLLRVPVPGEVFETRLLALQNKV